MFTLENKIDYNTTQLPNTHDFNGHHSELREIEGEVGLGGKVHSEIEGEMIYLKTNKKNCGRKLRHFLVHLQRCRTDSQRDVETALKIQKLNDSIKIKTS